MQTYILCPHDPYNYAVFGDGYDLFIVSIVVPREGLSSLPC